MKKVIVCQIGSRHRYLIPQTLFKVGMLSALYTDSTAHSRIGIIAKLLYRLGLRNKMQLRLINRLPGVKKNKVFSSDVLFWKRFLVKNIFSRNQFDQLETYYQGLVNIYKKWGTQGAKIVYNMYFENIDYLKFAKKQGLKIVVDIYEEPMVYNLLLEEFDKHEELREFLSIRRYYEESHRIRMKYVEDMLENADYYTVPSKYVIKSLAVFKSFDPSKAILMPYPTSLSSKYKRNKPKYGKFIWVGGDFIRKGLIYFAKAAKILNAKYSFLDFRVIGLTDDNLSTHKLFCHLNFRGVLNREQLIEEYCTAEAYVFPTLSEGFAGTVIEAASFGCPIITTQCAGTDLEEFPAIYISTRSVSDIVNSVSKLLEDRAFRDELSNETYKHSKDLDPEMYSQKLVSFLNSL